MSSVLEIEEALKQLAPQERWEIAHWLLEDLQGEALPHAEGKVSGDKEKQNLALPDYSSRRRQIFWGQGFAQYGPGISGGRALVKTYADTSFLFSLYATDANSLNADAWRQANPAPLPFTRLPPS